MLEFTIEVEINQPRDIVVERLHPENLPKWSKDFVKLEHIEGPLWEAGSKYDIHMRVMGVNIVMTETFVERDLPEYFSCIFENLTSYQYSYNWLKQSSHTKTLWVSTQKIKGLNIMNKIMMMLMPWHFKSYTRQHMLAFKAFAEQTDIAA